MSKTRSMIAAAALAAAACAIAPGRAFAKCTDEGGSGGDWPMYGKDLAGTRHQAAEDQITQATVSKLAFAWTAANVATSSTPIVAGKCVYSGGTDGTVRALDLATGVEVWRASTAPAAGQPGGALYSMSVENGVVHVNAEHTTYDGFPRAWTFDADTGALKWVSGPLAFGYPSWQLSNPAVWSGMHVQMTTGPDADPKARPGYAIYDAATGTVLHEQTAIPTADLDSGYAGGGVWATPAVDTASGYLFVGTANPFSKKIEHRYDNAIIKIDLDQSRPSFGTIAGAYKGMHDSLGLNQQPVCDIAGGKEPVSYHPSGYSIACAQLDIDFGASPTLWRNKAGELMVTELQKSGVVHTLYADTMQRAWVTIVSTLPPETAGNSASTAYDGQSIIVAPNAYLMIALDPETGRIKWATPGGESLNYHPPSVAGGVIYLMTGHGELNALDASNGLPLWRANAMADSGELCSPLSSGGVAIAHHTVIANCDNHLVAYRLPGAAPPPGPGGLPIPEIATPEGVPTILAGPAAAVTGYAPPQTPLLAGSKLTFLNADAIDTHDVVATDRDPATGLPLFQSRLRIEAGGTGEVVGADKLARGSYEFTCSTHGQMKGTLIVK